MGADNPIDAAVIGLPAETAQFWIAAEPDQDITSRLLLPDRNFCQAMGLPRIETG